MKTCFFIGHRETGERILPALAQEIERHVTEYGVICGGTLRRL